MDFKVVIPARFGSTRLPGKPLRDIAGKPLIQHVYERAAQSAASEVVVATDDERIADACAGFGASVALTRGDHQSGTDRVAEVAKARGWSRQIILVNLQGDEPCMPPVLIDQVATDLAARDALGMATLAYPISEPNDLFDPHVVKLVADADGYALYFSRAPIPWHRDAFAQRRDCLPPGGPFLRHIGLYAYRVAFLERFVNWRPAPLEIAESLEQLRVLCYGERIHVTEARVEPVSGVDTPSDLQRVAGLLEASDD